MLPSLIPAGDAALTVAEQFGVPTLYSDLGDRATYHFVEFFTAHIENANTRRAYKRAALLLADWCALHNLALPQLTPVHVAAFIEQLKRQNLSAPSIKLTLAGIRSLFDHLVIKQVMAFNPAAGVRGPVHVVRQGKTPVPAPDEARLLLDSIETDSLKGLRDRALIALLTYTFARIGAATKMRVKDYYPLGKRWHVRLHEKGGKVNEMPAHHLLESYLDAYLDAAGIREQRDSFLFRSFFRKTGQLTDKPLLQSDAWAMVNQRAKAAGVATALCNHSFRAFGITTYLSNGGDPRTAQNMAAHADPKTTQIYDRRSDAIKQSEVERIIF
jgi:site-specific recombinase XerD